MLGKKPNKVYDPFLIIGLGYKKPECLKKAIAVQPKMYHGEMLHSANLKIDSPYSEETLEDAEESRLKMRNKMVQINYGKLNTLYETFVPQQEFSIEQTYFSIPSTSNNGSESKEVTLDLPIPKIPKESKLIKINGRDYDSTPRSKKKSIQSLETASQSASDGVSVITRRRLDIQDGVRTMRPEETLEVNDGTTASGTLRHHRA
ncbi:hypothetical protein Tco_0122484 [Tanacetum coccineum]